MFDFKMVKVENEDLAGKPCFTPTDEFLSTTLRAKFTYF